MASIKNNLAYSFILSLSQVLLPLVSIPFIARVLDPAGIGKVNLIDSFTYYFITIAEFGITVYGTRAVSRARNNREALSTLVSELMMLHIICTGVTICIYSIAIFSIWPKLHDIRLILFSLSFLIVNAFACEWYFLGSERFKYITLRSLTTRLLGLLSLFVLIRQPRDYYIYYGIIVAAACGNALWNTSNLFREMPLKLKGANWKKHISYTLVTYGISLLSATSLMLDNVFLGLFSTVTAVAFYAFSIKIVRISGLLLGDSLLVFFPRIVHLRKEGRLDELQEMVLRSVQLIVFLCVPLCAGLFLLSEQLVQVYLGSTFLGVASNLKILCVFPFIKILSLFISKQILIAHDHERRYFKNLAAGTLVFCIAMPLLSYWFADKGACWAILLTEAAVLALNYYHGRKMSPAISFFDFVSFAQACLATLTFIPVTYFLQRWIPNQLVMLLVSILMCIVLYATLQIFVIRNSFALYVKKIVIQYVQKK